MQPTPPSPLSCWSCGTAVSADATRCPNCGNELPTVPASRPRPGPRPAPQPPSKAKKAVPIVVLIVGLSLIGLFAVAVAPDFAAVPTSPGPSASTQIIAPKATPPARPDGLGIADPKDVDPFTLLGPAKNRAAAWNREAVLVSIEAGPVLAGKVDLTAGAKVEYTFGKPTGGGFDTAGRVGPKQLQLSVDASRTRVEEIVRAPTRAAMEPNCTFDEAVKTAEASSAAPGAPLRVRYFMSERHDKAIWQTEVPEDPKTRRVLDGWTCRVLVR